MNLSFEVDQSSGVCIVHAGDVLSGRLLVNADKSVSATCLAVYFRGKEETTVVYHKTERRGDKSHRVRKTAHGKTQITRQNIEVPNESQSSIIQNGKVMPGSYQVPFRIQVPTGIPSSMTNRQGNGTAAITYALKAVLKGSGIFQDYQQRHPIQVVAAPELAHTVPYIVQPITNIITSCCCFSHGAMTCGAKVQDTQLFRGQNAQVKVASVNDSSANIDHIELALMQHIWCQAGSHSDTSRTKLCIHVVPTDESHNKLDKQALKQKMQDANREHNNNLVILQSLNNDDAWLTLPPVPETAFNTYQGSLIRITHKLRIKLGTTSNHTNPELFVPVKIATGVTPSGSAPQTNPELHIIPVAPALPIPNNNHSDPPMNPNYYQNPSNDDDIDIDIPTVHVVAPPDTNPDYNNQLPTMDYPGSPPSIDQLVELMTNSVDDLAIVQLRVTNAAWDPVFANLSPADFGRILQMVHLDVNEIPVARTVAAHVTSNNNNFTCQHVAAALPFCSEYSKSTMVEQLIPFCVDLPQNHSQITRQLSDWDKMATDAAIQNAINGR